MSINKTISKDYFVKRLTNLCLKSGLSGFPKDETSLHILLKSAIVMMGQPEQLTEKEVNAKLETWVKEVGEGIDIDYVSLRRELVDTGYLTRTADGSSYQVAQPGPYSNLFDEAIDHLDISQEIATAQEDIARRKREYLEKAKGG